MWLQGCQMGSMYSSPSSYLPCPWDFFFFLWLVSNLIPLRWEKILIWFHCIYWDLLYIHLPMFHSGSVHLLHLTDFLFSVSHLTINGLGQLFAILLRFMIFMYRITVPYQNTQSFHYFTSVISRSPLCLFFLKNLHNILYKIETRWHSHQQWKIIFFCPGFTSPACSVFFDIYTFITGVK